MCLRYSSIDKSPTETLHLFHKENVAAQYWFNQAGKLIAVLIPALLTQIKPMNEIEIWGGVECTLNRVKNNYLDQLEFTGHYTRGESDIDLIASLKIKKMRYPVLWEKHLPEQDSTIDWTFTDKNLDRL